jgi:hypothetical protein
MDEQQSLLGLIQAVGHYMEVQSSKLRQWRNSGPRRQAEKRISDARSEALDAGFKFWRLATIAYLENRRGIADWLNHLPKKRLLGDPGVDILDTILRESFDLFERDVVVVLGKK